MVILPQIGPDKILAYGERVCQKVKDLGRILNQRFSGHPITLSIGMVSVKNDSDSRDILKKASQPYPWPGGKGETRS